MGRLPTVMEWIVLLLNFSVLFGVTLLLNYYRRLFMDGRNEYSKEEILRPISHLMSELKLFFEKEPTLIAGSVVAGFLLGLLVSSFGGIYGYYYESYLFLSAIIPLLVTLSLPYIHDLLEIDIASGTLLGKIFRQDNPFLFGMTLVIIARMLTAYGFHHKISFWWVLLNLAGGIILLLYKLYRDDQELPFAAPAQTEDVGELEAELDEEEKS